MIKARMGQRFIAWLVDTIITGVVITLVSALFMFIFNIEAPKSVKKPSEVVYTETCNYLDEKAGYEISVSETYVFLYTGMLSDKDVFEIESILEGFGTGYADEFDSWRELCVKYNDDYLSYAWGSLGVTLIVSLIIVFCYYDLLGYFWKKQTLGRMLTRIKVVNLDGSQPDILHLALRDVVGYNLFYLLNVCCGAPVIINAIMISGQGFSVGDRMSGTYMTAYDDLSISQAQNNRVNEADPNFSDITDAEIIKETYVNHERSNVFDEDSIYATEEEEKEDRRNAGYKDED